MSKKERRIRQKENRSKNNGKEHRKMKDLGSVNNHGYHAWNGKSVTLTLPSPEESKANGTKLTTDTIVAVTEELGKGVYIKELRLPSQTYDIMSTGQRYRLFVNLKGSPLFLYDGQGYWDRLLSGGKCKTKADVEKLYGKMVRVEMPEAPNPNIMQPNDIKECWERTEKVIDDIAKGGVRPESFTMPKEVYNFLTTEQKAKLHDDLEGITIELYVASGMREETVCMIQDKEALWNRINKGTYNVDGDKELTSTIMGMVNKIYGNLNKKFKAFKERVGGFETPKRPEV